MRCVSLSSRTSTVASRSNIPYNTHLQRLAALLRCEHLHHAMSFSSQLRRCACSPRRFEMCRAFS